MTAHATGTGARALTADQLVQDMTLAEKAALVCGAGLWQTAAVERLGVAALNLSDGPHGLRRQPLPGSQAGAGKSLPATCFPPAVALGSSWDATLLEAVGAAVGREAITQDVQVVLGPGINLKRSPLCGRNFEYLSEDPHLSGVLGAAMVTGIQSRGVGACVKHFAANNQETDRFRVSADVDERTLREIYLASFEHVITEAKPLTVMCAYNRVNGVLASQHRWLLTTVLRDQWGFDGVVMSDWGAVADRVAALSAGLDLEMPTSGGRAQALLVEAVRDGRLDERVLDTSVRRMLALGALTTERPDPGRAPTADEHHALARDVAGQCAVLLKNDRGILPLHRELAIAVVGELARTPRYQGGGSSRVNPTRLDDALTAMQALASSITFAPGYLLDTDEPNPAMEADATAAAAHADVVVVFLGLPESAESEGYDRTGIDLPANQVALLRRVVAANPNVVVVLSNGSVVRLSDWADDVPAILEGWLLGQAGGSALSDILFGVVNPSGRLAETIPLRLQDTPAYLNFPGELGHVRYGEGVFVGYRHYDARDLPVSYPFGHGLSYTTFEYSDLVVDVSGRDETAAVRVSLSIANTGDRAGAEVVQLYLAVPSAIVSRPVRELRGFRKVTVEAGMRTRVHFTLRWRDFAFFHPQRGTWFVEGGEIGIEVGASSRNIRLTTAVEVPVTPEPPPITADSPLSEWAEHPAGLALLEREMKRSGAEPYGLRFISDEGLPAMGSAPLSRLANFPGSGLDADRLEQLVAEINQSR
jgi:beta-glucosidase